MVGRTSRRLEAVEALERYVVLMSRKQRYTPSAVTERTNYAWAGNQVQPTGVRQVPHKTRSSSSWPKRPWIQEEIRLAKMHGETDAKNTGTAP